MVKQNEKLLKAENEMNQMKLKMLIKFDQIKVIEDFYNSYFEQQPEEQIHLDLEISEFEL